MFGSVPALDAVFLLQIFDVIYVLALTALVGSISYFSFGVAPTIFEVLPADQGARFVRTLFPHYYLWNTYAAVVALPALVIPALTHTDLRSVWLGIQAVMVIGVVLTMLYSGQVLTPAINAARDAGPEQDARFQALHRRSVVLNGLTLLVGLVLLASFAVRPDPSNPILELTPEERLAEQLRVRQMMETISEEDLRDLLRIKREEAARRGKIPEYLMDPDAALDDDDRNPDDDDPSLSSKP